MKYGLLILAAIVPSMALAQSLNKPQRADSPETAAAAFAVQAPDEGSPFFSERAAAQAYATTGTIQQRQENDIAIYPKVKNSPDSATAIFQRFFTDMFSSVKIGALRGEPFTEELTITPQEFSLQDRRDVETKYWVRNNTGKMVRLVFPTTQRIEIITRDAAGNPVDKWSDDRAFKPQEGLVIINPKERIEYIESIPTREMKVGENYSIQAEVIGYPDYTVTKPISPTP